MTSLKSRILNLKSGILNLKSGIWNLESGILNLKFRYLLTVLIAVCVAGLGVVFLSTEVLARVGGGQSYGGGGGGGGGGSSGGGDGGGAGALVYFLIRFLIWLTFEHPAIGIPVDIIVIGLVIYWFRRKSKPDLRIASGT